MTETMQREVASRGTLTFITLHSALVGSSCDLVLCLLASSVYFLVHIYIYPSAHIENLRTCSFRALVSCVANLYRLAKLAITHRQCQQGTGNANRGQALVSCTVAIATAMRIVASVRDGPEVQLWRSLPALQLNSVDL